MKSFINEMKNENIVLKDIGVSGSKSDILKTLEEVYLITDKEMSLLV